MRESWEGARTSFEENVFCNYFNDSLDKRSRFLETYNIVEDNEYGFILKSLVDGLRLFEKTFGFKSKSMIAPNYIWDEKIEEKAFKNGVKYLQGSSIRRNTMVNKNNGNKSMFSKKLEKSIEEGNVELEQKTREKIDEMGGVRMYQDASTFHYNYKKHSPDTWITSKIIEFNMKPSKV